MMELIVRTGGGYVLPATEFMVDFMFQVVDVLNKKGKDASCLFLSYGTSLIIRSLS